MNSTSMKTNPVGLTARVVVGRWHLTEDLRSVGSDALVFIESSRPVHSLENGELSEAVDRFRGKVYVHGRTKPVQMTFNANGYEWLEPTLLRGPIRVATDHEVVLWRAKQELTDGKGN